MSAENNKNLVREVVEVVWNAGNADAVDRYYALDFVGHWPDREIHGTEGLKQQVAGIHAAALNIEFLIEDRIAVADRVLTRFVQRCSRKENPNGVAPTRQHATRVGTSVVRIAHGKIVEQWISYED